MRKVNNSINVLKGAAAILIFFIHAPFSGIVGQSITAVARSAVALFFLISGFFLFDSDDKQKIKENIERKLFRILRLAFFSYLFYLSYGILVRYVCTGKERVLSWFSELLQLENVCRILAFHIDILAGHLWFLNALIVCYLFVILTNEWVKSSAGFICSLILLFIHLFTMNLLPLFYDIGIDMIVFRNGWFYGLPIFILGVHTRIQFDRGVRYKNTFLWTMVGITVGMILIERTIMGYHQIYIGNILFLLSIFYWCLQNPDVINCKFFRILGECYYTEIYIFHWAVLGVVDKIFRIAKIKSKWGSFTICALIGTLGFVWVLKKFQFFLLRRLRNLDGKK